MSLHEFLADHRDEAVARVVEKLRKRYPDRSPHELKDNLPTFVDEIVEALVRAEEPGQEGALQAVEATGAHLGMERLQEGYPITSVPETIGYVASTFGELGEREDQKFDAGEYRVLNESVDAAVSHGIDQYWRDAQTQQQRIQMQEIGAFAHELRNALSSARMAFSILRQGGVGIAGRTGDLLGRSLARMQALVTEVLGAVTLEAALRPKLDTIPLRVVFDEIAESSVRERGVRIVVEPLPGDLAVVADERLLASALTNLVQNGLKFTRDQGRVAIRAYAEDDTVVIDVEDECGGLPPGKQDELFAPFVQEGEDRRGVGLGLAITRKAMQAQRGEVTVRDLPGTGCIFSLRLARGGRNAQGNGDANDRPIPH